MMIMFMSHGDGDENNEDDGDTINNLENDTGQLSQSLRCSRSWLA